MPTETQHDVRHSRRHRLTWPQTRIDARDLLHRWEGATALMLANTPTPQASISLARALPLWLRWREHPVGAFVAAAARHPERIALIDDDGGVSFRALDEDSNALARAWRRAGIEAGATIGVLTLPGRVFMLASLAAQKMGAHVVYLNAAFSGHQVSEVVESEGIDLVVHDDALAPTARSARSARCLGVAELQEAISSTQRGALRPPPAPGRVVVLTSGTTGRPKGARRAARSNPMDAAGLLACLPVMSGDPFVVAAPLFHGLGLFGATLGLTLSSTVSVRARFDAETTLADIAATRAKVLIVVPVMLQRILALPRNVRRSHNVSSLKVVLCGGSALPVDVAKRFTDEFGPVLYNFYGSTEAGWATCATPKDLEAAPGTTGRATPGVTVRVVDDHGDPVGPGVTGRILVGSRLRMDEYTGGTHKDIIDGLVATGDVGHMDRARRLFIDGRDDEMIVSGGENVFPAEVEETLVAHPAIFEAAVIGVADEEFGQRLKAFVVSRPAMTLSGDEVKRFVHDRLARFKTPRDVVFLDELPRNATGKILKKELAKL